ncbi:hypothetical protein ACFV1X_21550 [Streptomyces coelicoflavus]|uniref:hypothetical protein n=1 Tax=Streptomyces coelicoflavus TaxID=285562 RepID=UPI00369F73EF
MGQISSVGRRRNEDAIRAAMDRLLRGELPPGGRCDLKTLAAEAGVNRTGFYPKKDRDGSVREGPYQHLGDKFVRRMAALREAGEVPDPRDAQIERLKAHTAELKARLADRDATIGELTAFKKLALSRLAAQHDEIMHLRCPQPSLGPSAPGELASVPRTRTTVIGTCG